MKYHYLYNGNEFNDEISERNHKFKCEECHKEIYGKWCKEEVGGGTITICLKCLMKGYGGYLISLVKHKEKKEFEKLVKEIKKKYALDLVVEEL